MIEEPPSKRRMVQDEDVQHCHSSSKIPKRFNARQKHIGGIILDDSDDDDVESGSDIPRHLELRKSSELATGDSLGSNIASARSTCLSFNPLPSAQRSIFGLSNESTNDPPDKAAKIIKTCNGTTYTIQTRQPSSRISYEQMIAAQSIHKDGRGKKAYYGIAIHDLMAQASLDERLDLERQARADDLPKPSVEPAKPKKTLMWMEKYRAKNFMELVGDDRTHRQVLRWLKAWDKIVFPKAGKSRKRPDAEEKAQKKILLLTGPPGLGKTTLAHVCAKQAGYEVLEINASDERSSTVVKGRIRTSVGTESVKIGATVTTKAGSVKSTTAHPLCVVVDEVDGVVSGAGASGEGGFIKALIDLVQLDQKNSSGHTSENRRRKPGDKFKILRPLILICNDVYHPSLRPLRQSGLAEIIHVRKPHVDNVAARIKTIFEKEGVSCDADAARRICEVAWGTTAIDAKRKDEGPGEGDIRGVMVLAEWAALKLKSHTKSGSRPKISRHWIESNILADFSSQATAKGVGRGGTKEIAHRVFLEGAGFPKATIALAAPNNKLPNQPAVPSEAPIARHGVSEALKRSGINALRSIIDTSGSNDSTNIMNEIFTNFPLQNYNDDSGLTKTNECYEWLHFHDICSSRVWAKQEFELAGYLAQPILAAHNLFAGPRRQFKSYGDDQEESEDAAEPLPFTGPRAEHQAHEASKENRAMLIEVQAALNISLQRSFRSVEEVASELLPWVLRMLAPDVKPTIVGSSGDSKGVASVRRDAEKDMVRRAVDVMLGVGVIFERGRLEDPNAAFGSKVEWIYRMDPYVLPLLNLATLLLA